MALAPCLLGYGAIARRLYTEKETLRVGNKYWKWIENYVADDYTEAVEIGSGMSCPYEDDNTGKACILTSIIELLERHMHKVSPSRLEELVKIFIRATELEIGFWDMGLSGKPV